MRSLSLSHVWPAPSRGHSFGAPSGTAPIVWRNSCAATAAVRDAAARAVDRRPRRRSRRVAPALAARCCRRRSARRSTRGTSSAASEKPARSSASTMPANRFEIGVSCAPESVERTVVTSSCVPHENGRGRSAASRVGSWPRHQASIWSASDCIAFATAPRPVRAVGRDQVHPVHRVAGDAIRRAVGRGGRAAPVDGRRSRTRAPAATRRSLR